MLNAEEIKKIEIGPRQLFLFDLEDHTVAVRKKVIEQAASWLQAHAEVQVLAFCESVSEGLGVSALTALQHLFWLAHDLKIQFTSAGRAISPNQARTQLIHSPKAPVALVVNQTVGAAVFKRVKGLLNRMDAEAGAEAPDDVVALAHRLTRKLHTWKSQLEICRTRARRPGFPGKKAIADALTLLRTISAKMDALCLIHAFDAHAGALARLDADIKSLTRFYDEYTDQWRRLLQFAGKAAQTLETFEADDAITAAYRRFRQILSDSSAYYHVDEACRLQRSLTPCHERILAQRTQQRRADVCLKIRRLIQKMKAHLDSHAVDDDTRNQSLYTLRQHLMAAETASTIERINRRMRSADEDYELWLDEVGGV
jgi:hypothetical protein